MEQRLRRLLVFVGCLLWITPVFADLVIGDLTLVSKQRVGRADFNYTYQVDITNNGPNDFQDVTATVSSSFPQTTIVDGNLTFGNVPAGTTVTSSDTITFRQDRRFPFVEGALGFDVQATPVPPADTESPEITIIKPAGGEFVIEPRPLVMLTFSDDTDIDTGSLSLSANDQDLNIECQLTQTDAQCSLLDPLPEGSVNLSASIADQAGNATTTSVQITVDTSPIDIAITSPIEGFVTPDAQIVVAGTVGAGVTSVDVNGVSAAINGGNFSATVPLREGDNMLVAVASKASGRTTTATVDITRDIFAPIVQINSPGDGFVSVNNSVDVTGIVNDIVDGAVAPTVMVNGVAATVANGAFMAMDVPLVNGPNTITVTATDAVGNQGEHSINVTFQQPVGPHMVAASGSGQSALTGSALPEPLVAAIKDGLGNPVSGRIVQFEVARNSGSLRVNPGDTPKRRVQVPTDGSGLARVLFTLGDTAGEGNNRVRAAAAGVAGEVEFCATGIPGQADGILLADGDNQRGVAGAPLPIPYEARVVDIDGNPVAGIDVTFTVEQGGGVLNGASSLVRTTDANGMARAVLTLGTTSGVNNNVVRADFPNLTRLPIRFTATALAPADPANTRFSGVVLDNALTPIPGATVSIAGAAQSGQTDADGRFSLAGVPVGQIHLHIDPSTSPRTETFPPLDFEAVTVAGQDNDLGQPIRLPAIETASSKLVGGNSDVTLTMPGVPGLSLTVFANSTTFPDGSPSGQLSISQVHQDKIPMPPPNGGVFTPPAWTIQPAGVKFDPPARITLPNNGQPAGQVIDIFQFDHTLNEFINVGKGTVSEDGSVITTDPGFGITRAGWGGGAPPPPPLSDWLLALLDKGAEAIDAITRAILGNNGATGGETQNSPNVNGSGLPDGSSGQDPNAPSNFGPGEQKANVSADPVILRTGELVVSETDLRIPGRGFDFVMKRHYRSQFNLNGPLGHNWDFSYNERLLLPASLVPGEKILRCSGRSRVDGYTLQADGSFVSPDGFFDRMVQNPDGSFTIRNNNGFKTNFMPDGRLASMVDRNGNTMSFAYDANNQLSTVTDTLGRDIQFSFNSVGRLVSVTDFNGRQIRYAYDGNGDLVSVRSPVVTGTSNGNDFINGKITRYEYASGFDPSADPRLEFLNHNLVAITDPKGQRYQVNTYGTDPNAYDFDRVLTQQYGDPGQVFAYTYTELNSGATITPDLPRNQTVEIDRNGNRTVFIHNELGNLLEERVETNRNINPDDPGVFVTTHTYNADGERLSTTYPEGNSTVWTLDDTNPDRFQQGNIIQVTHNPGPRGGDQAAITTRYAFEPIYNQVRAITEPRGNDSAFTPQNGGTASAARYTTTMLFDYQEGNDLAALANETGQTQATVSAQLANAGVSLGLGDLNDDGDTTRINGNTVQRTQPTVNLLAGSRQAAIEGDTTQEIVWTYTYNRFGQKTSVTDPDGNVDDYLYHSEADPDGDGNQSISSRTLATDTGGYRSEVIYDARSSSRRQSSVPLTRISNKFFYDPVGNIIRTIDGRGNPTVYEVNALNQVIKTTLEPPFNYEKLVFYDANNNIIREEIQNKDTNGPGLDGFVTYTYDYDTLDYLTRKTEEVSASEILVTRYQYDSNQNRVLRIEPEGNMHSTVYDERDLVFSVTRGAGSPGASTTTRTYDGNRNLVRLVDAQDNTGDGQNDVTRMTYDGYDREISSVDAVGNVMQYNYDPASNIVREQRFGPNGGPSPTNANGAGNVLLSDTFMLFDELSREFQMDQALFANTTAVGPEGPLTAGDGKVTMRYEYDRNSRKTRVLNDNNHETRLEYDGVDRVFRTVDELGNELLSTYDDNHNRLTLTEIEKSPEGTVADETFVTAYQYDSIDRKTRLTDNLGNQTAYTYDSRNNVTSVTDQLGNTRTYTWDGINRKLAEITDLRSGGTGSGSIDTGNPDNNDGQITKTYDWDRNSRLASETDDNGNVTAYQYDALNRKVLDTFADGTTNQYVYDRDDNIVSFTDENDSVHTNSYDGIDRLVSKTVTRAAGVGGTTRWTWEYDGLSRLTQATDNNDPAVSTDDSVVSYDYDSLSRQLVETQNGKTVTRIIDGVGNRLGLIYPDARRINASFDGLERLDGLTDANGARLIADYDYIGPARVLERRYGNGTRLSYHDGNGNDVGYDGLKRRIGIFHRRADDSLIAGFQHAFDKEDNRRFEQDLFRNTADVFEYDSAYRVTRSTLGLADSAVNGIQNNATTNADVSGLTSPTESSYRLDGVGNWTQRDRDGSATAYTANQMNEYATIGAAAQTHDDNGNLTDDGNRTYRYDFANRLIGIDDSSGSPIARYTYDAIGRRITKTAGGNTTAFYYDKAHAIEERDGADAVLRQYVFGRSLDEALELRDAANSSFFYHQNYLNSTSALTDSSGAVVERYSYREYGETSILAADGTTVLGASGVSNPYRYTGRRFDDESNLYYYRARFYSPVRGRFLQRDPKGYADGMGLYQYVSSNPLNYVDPFGTEKNNSGAEKPSVGKDCSLTNWGPCPAPKWMVDASEKLLEGTAYIDEVSKGINDMIGATQFYSNGKTHAENGVINNYDAYVVGVYIGGALDLPNVVKGGIKAGVKQGAKAIPKLKSGYKTFKGYISNIADGKYANEVAKDLAGNVGSRVGEEENSQQSGVLSKIVLEGILRFK